MLAIKQAIYDYYSESEESGARESVERAMHSCNTNDDEVDALFSDLFD